MSGSPGINRSMSALEWGLLLTLALIWGGAFFFNGVAVRELPTFTVVVARLAGAAIVLHLALRILRIPFPTSPEIWGAFLFMGLMNNAVPFSLLVWGQAEIGSGVASILNATTPLFTVLVAHGMTRDEKITGGRLVGVLLGLAGVAVMIGGTAASAMEGHLLPQLACLGAALAYAFAGVFGRRFQRLGVPPMATATGQVTASSLILLPAALMVDTPWLLPLPSAAAIASLIAVATVSTALAYIIYFRILATAGATNLLLVTLIIPPVAIVLGVLVLGEVLLPRHLAGLGLIALGLAAIDGRPAGFLGRRIYRPAGRSAGRSSPEGDV